jgi:hypothetical protein
MRKVRLILIVLLGVRRMVEGTEVLSENPESELFEESSEDWIVEGCGFDVST